MTLDEARLVAQCVGAALFARTDKAAEEAVRQLKRAFPAYYWQVAHGGVELGDRSGIVVEPANHDRATPLASAPSRDDVKLP